MAETKFNKGDVVVLKSGGPTMTVNVVSTIGGASYLCYWFDNQLHRHEGSFNEDTLELAVD